jgi:large subunit ribosomal protein L13
MTGKKWNNEKHYWHTGYPGGIKEKTQKQILEDNPERIIMKAVERMLPKTKLGRKQITGLRVYAGAEHDHEAQKPTKIDFASKNPKNVKRS